MELNLRTAVTVIFWLALASTVLAIAIRSARRSHPGYGRWAIAGLLLVLSLFLLSLRSASGWINTVSADAGIAMAFILYLEGAQEFRGLLHRNWLVYAGGVVAIGAVTFFRYSLPNMNARAAVMSAFAGIVLTLISICLLRGIPPAHRFGQTFTGGMFALCAATNVARASYCYFGPLMNDQNMLSGLNGIFFLAVAGEMAAFSVGLTLMADERMTSDLRDVRERVSRADVEVAQHIEAEAALRESEERYRNLAERLRESEAFLRESEAHLKNAERLAHIGHWHWDLRSNQVAGSEEMYRIFGKQENYTPTHEGFLQDLVPRDKERVESAIRDSIANKTGHSMEYQVVLPNRDVRTISCIWEVSLDKEGLPERLFGTCQDITDLRRAQEEALARQKLESVGTLASGIAHDFNNLLGAVRAQADLAAAELEAGSSCKEELKAIGEVAMRGSEIVRQLMIYAGKESEVVGVVDISKIVEEMLPLIRVSVSKHAVLNADLGQNLPAIRASGAQLRQIVMNLVTNASDALGDRDGVIRVTTRHLITSATVPESMSEGDYLVLEVSDTGCGMSSETRARVFDPFFTTKSAGHGLGLAVVDGIIRGLRGAIHVTSELGKGTTFQILLPSVESTGEATSHALPTIEKLESSSIQASILIVEDEDALRRPVAKMLRSAGFQILEAADGSSAIDLLRAAVDKIDMILLDLTIPGASSAEVVAEAARTRPDIRVILTSAYCQEMLTAPLSAAQVRGFIRKPFQVGDLVKTLRRAASA
jgi:signal transduction histidine kinase/CheY-like chemotaxis protein